MIEFPLLCRLCGSKTENGLYIYCDEGKRRQVLPSDSLPKKICASCFEELEGMHRFAINALKVQDNLSRLSKELPMAAIDVCKTFMTSYIREPVVVNDTIASLTSQEVTELEVQVDPMIFLEDDQSEDGAQDTAVNAGTEAIISANGLQTMPQNNGKNDFENKDKPNEPSSLKDGNLEYTEEMDIAGVHIESDQKHTPSNEPKYTMKEENGEDVDKLECAPLEKLQDSPYEKRSEELSVHNGNLTDSHNKEAISEQGGSSPDINLEKKAKKTLSVSKSSKRSELKPASTESIKYTTYTCPICKKVFMKRGLFKAHLETHKTDLKFACEICLRVFKKEVNLIRHRKSHSELTTFPCAHCNRVYPTKSTLRSHLVSHSDERPHVCNICSKSFKRNQDLKFHLNQHNGLRPYHCPYCTKAFASSGNCFSHRRRAHMEEIERDRALRKSTATSD